MTSVRIRGLVAAYRRIRDEIGQGIASSERDVLLQRVQDITAEVESICADHDTTPEELPTPSRNAYRYLKEVDPATWPAATGRDKPASQPRGSTRAGGTGHKERSGPPRVPVQNVVKTWKSCSDSMWEKAGRAMRRRPDRLRLHKPVRRLARDVERILGRRDAVPSQLAVRSRNAFLSARMLVDNAAFDGVLARLDKVRAGLGNWQLSADKTIVRLQVQRPLWRIRRRRGRTVLSCHLGFFDAPDTVWDGLLAAAIRGEGGSVVDDYSLGPEFAAVMRAIQECLGDAETTGMVHDLMDSFERVNGEFFAGEMEAPRLVWSRAPTFRKFGHYDFVRDELMLSSSLDQPDVPEWVIDFVMYHELLHKRHGLAVTKKRKMAHTRAFREAERLYPRYEEAERYLTRISARLR